MGEEKIGKVVLLDGRIMEFRLTPKLMYGELMKQAAVLLSLKEIEYFGLYCEREYPLWLIPDKKLLDQDLVKKSSIATLYFGVKFFVDSVLMLKDSITVELFYLQAKQLLVKGILDPDQEKMVDLVALNLQADFGDFKSKDVARAELYKNGLLSRTFVETFSSKEKCEEEIISKYVGLKSTSIGHAILRFMNIVERLPTYGLHFYRLKDKSDALIVLGISGSGISVFDNDNTRCSKFFFHWKQLENLYYRERKFSVEANENPRSFARVFSWFATTGLIAKSVWCMSVAQHQFYLHSQYQRNASRRCIEELANELTSLHVSPSLTVKTPAGGSNLTKLLYAKRTLLERMLSFRLDEAVYLMAKEAQFCQEPIQDWPSELINICPLANVHKPLQPNEAAIVRKQIENSKKTDLQFCFLEYEAQAQIVACAKEMLLEQAIPQSCLRRRFKFYVQANEKLEKISRRKKDLEKEINLCTQNRISDHTSKSLTSDKKVSKGVNENTRCMQLHRTPSYKWALDKSAAKSASQRCRVPCRPKELKNKMPVACNVPANWNSLERQKKTDHDFYHLTDDVSKENACNAFVKEFNKWSLERTTLV